LGTAKILGEWCIEKCCYCNLMEICHRARSSTAETWRYRCHMRYSTLKTARILQDQYSQYTRTSDETGPSRLSTRMKTLHHVEFHLNEDTHDALQTDFSSTTRPNASEAGPNKTGGCFAPRYRIPLRSSASRKVKSWGPEMSDICIVSPKELYELQP
jgi:hypothetical protein